MHRAEIIAIGDELTSGVRLDTNTQWLSQRLGDLGIPVAFHSTVGDDLSDMTNTFQIASERADIILVTGGLGPTADDLTRQAIADMAGVELAKDENVLNHIREIYKRYGKVMPTNNEIQAWFPNGSNVINNPEGTAPGIDFVGTGNSDYRIFALPGVPVEMKQMWAETVESEIKSHTGVDFVIHHHTLHCFGTGESQIETLLPDLIARGRDPQVGITASSATISLRISTRGDSIDHCMEKIQPSVATIHECLGDLVFGENGQTLEEIVAATLATTQEDIAIVDFGLNGSVGQFISATDNGNVLVTSQTLNGVTPDIQKAAVEIKAANDASFGVAIGPINRDESTIAAGESHYEVAIADASGEHVKEIRFSGHSGWREVRAVKEVLNYFRLHLLGKRES